MKLKEKLSKLRSQVDELDQHILKILDTRFELARQIGEIKYQAGIPVDDPQRENEIINTLTEQTKLLTNDEIAQIFKPVYRISKKFQRRID
ncbi:MAG: chorismate mutase [Fidelibacterota bacterium]